MDGNNEWGVYEYVTVESGDTLSQIAYDIYDDASLSGQLAEINGIGNPNRIKIGQTIITPGTAPTKQRNYNDMNDQVTVTHDVEIAIITTFVPGYRVLKPIIIGATSSLVLKGSYSPKYAARLQSAYQVFRNAGVEIVEHGLNRVLGRAARGVTIENTIDAFKNGVKYYDPKYDTFIRFKDGIAVSIDKATGAIISVQEQAKATARWILQ